MSLLEKLVSKSESLFARTRRAIPVFTLSTALAIGGCVLQPSPSPPTDSDSDTTTPAPIIEEPDSTPFPVETPEEPQQPTYDSNQIAPGTYSGAITRSITETDFLTNKTISRKEIGQVEYVIIGGVLDGMLPNEVREMKQYVEGETIKLYYDVEKIRTGIIRSETGDEFNSTTTYRAQELMSQPKDQRDRITLESFLFAERVNNDTNDSLVYAAQYAIEGTVFLQE